jgi:hypothetical protein
VGREETGSDIVGIIALSVAPAGALVPAPPAAGPVYAILIMAAEIKFRAKSRKALLRVSKHKFEPDGSSENATRKTC